MKQSTLLKDKLIVGWSEWCALPTLHLPAIKAKIDTGATTSAIHAFDVEHYTRAGKEFVRFNVLPIQARDDIVVACHSPLVDERHVTSSDGHRELRPVVSSQLVLGGKKWQIELTLSNREPMTFRMLLGREALAGHALVDSSHTLLLDKRTKKKAIALYED